MHKVLYTAHLRNQCTPKILKPLQIFTNQAEYMSILSPDLDFYASNDSARGICYILFTVVLIKGKCLTPIQCCFVEKAGIMARTETSICGLQELKTVAFFLLCIKRKQNIFMVLIYPIALELISPSNVFCQRRTIIFLFNSHV